MSEPAGDRGATALTFSRDAAREVDRRALETYGIPGIVLMENAARALREAALEMLHGERATPDRSTRADAPRVTIVCGPGNNGGDGYALARHLHNDGCAVTLIAIKPPRDGTDAATNRAICKKMRLRALPFTDRHKATSPDLMVDAVLGTGVDQPAHGDPAKAIEWMNHQAAPILAVDVPSGLDCDTGEPLGVSVRATRTVTFVGIKAGFINEAAEPYLGSVSIGDIGVPVELVRSLGR